MSRTLRYSQVLRPCLMAQLAFVEAHCLALLLTYMRQRGRRATLGIPSARQESQFSEQKLIAALQLAIR